VSCWTAPCSPYVPFTTCYVNEIQRGPWPYQQRSLLLHSDNLGFPSPHLQQKNKKDLDIFWWSINEWLLWRRSQLFFFVHRQVARWYRVRDTRRDSFHTVFSVRGWNIHLSTICGNPAIAGARCICIQWNKLGVYSATCQPTGSTSRELGLGT
jgi:hypothetical protein